jgi:hypothetical protein
LGRTGSVTSGLTSWNSGRAGAAITSTSRDDATDGSSASSSRDARAPVLGVGGAGTEAIGDDGADSDGIGDGRTG